MTARKFKSSLDPMYSRIRSEEHCTHAPEAHVRYDREAAAYRAGYYCSCGKVKAASAKVHADPAKADREAVAMLARDRLLARAVRQTRAREPASINPDSRFPVEPSF